MARAAIPKFQIANFLYAGASITFGVKMATKATLYDSETGSGTLSNPVALDGEGKFKAIAWADEAVIGSIAGLEVSDHDTGILNDGQDADEAAASATAAAASATAAATSETNAATSETNAARSETNAGTSETNAAASASAASSSAWPSSTRRARATPLHPMPCRCVWCDRQFEPGRRGSPQRFCSAGCRGRFHRALRTWAWDQFEAGLVDLRKWRQKSVHALHTQISSPTQGDGPPKPVRA